MSEKRNFVRFFPGDDLTYIEKRTFALFVVGYDQQRNKFYNDVVTQLNNRGIEVRNFDFMTDPEDLINQLNVFVQIKNDRLKELVDAGEIFRETIDEWPVIALIINDYNYFVKEVDFEYSREIQNYINKLFEFGATLDTCNLLVILLTEPEDEVLNSLEIYKDIARIQFNPPHYYGKPGFCGMVDEKLRIPHNIHILFERKDGNYTLFDVNEIKNLI